jgi:hypothetical protein
MSGTKRKSSETKDNRSWIGWTLFSKRDANGKHACKICGDEYTYSNSTASFKKHLKKEHGETWSELQKNKEVAAELARDADPSTTILDFIDPSKIAKRKEASKALVKSLEKDLVRFIVGDIRPFHSVEGANFPFLFECCLH